MSRRNSTWSIVPIHRGRNVAARQFFDEEAEVSQEGSGSSDGSDDRTDLDGFIVCTADATPAHSGSRQAGGDTPDSRYGSQSGQTGGLGKNRKTEGRRARGVGGTLHGITAEG